MDYAHPSWIEIDSSQLVKNIEIIRSKIGKTLLCLPVKANAYGHGLIGVSKIAEAAGVDALAVSCLQEGAELRKAGIQCRIIVLGAIHEDQVEDLVHFNLEFSISSQYKAELVAKKLSQKCRVHLEVETGIQRTGVRPATALGLIQYLQSIPCFEVVGVYSHFAQSEIPKDPVTLKQLQIFQELCALPPFRGLTRHMANSGGVLYYPEVHLDMVRPGILCYGYLPGKEKLPSAFEGIAPCLTLKSKISYFKVVEAGLGIGYNHTYYTKKKTRIVTIPIGYGDGFSRMLSNRGSVLIRGKRFSIAGIVCMDQFMVDVGDEEMYVGDEVVLIGKQGNEEISLQEMANTCQSVPYEILCLFNQRIPRKFKGAL